MKKINNKGITLIALVITIIIMIILVAVSVALAIKGDLFGNAQKGVEDTRKEAEKEQLTEYVYGQYKKNADGKVEVNLEEVQEILNGDADKFNGDAKIDGDKLTVTGKDGTIYTVDKSGKIETKSAGNIENNNDKISFCFNDFKDCYSLSCHGLIEVPIEDFKRICGFEGEIFSSKYYTGAPDELFIVCSDDSKGIVSSIAEYAKQVGINVRRRWRFYYKFLY